MQSSPTAEPTEARTLLSSRSAESIDVPLKKVPDDEEVNPILHQQLWLAKLLQEEALRDDASDDGSEASLLTREEASQRHRVHELMDNLSILWSSVRRRPPPACTRRHRKKIARSPRMLSVRRPRSGARRHPAACRRHGTTWPQRTSSISSSSPPPQPSPPSLHSSTTSSSL